MRAKWARHRLADAFIALRTAEFLRRRAGLGSEQFRRDRYIPGTLDRRPATQTLERYRRSYVEKLAHGALGPEHVHRHMLSVLREDLQLSFALRTADSPDAPNQPPFIAKPTQTGLVTAVWQLEVNRARSNPTHERAPCADPPPCVEEHDRVCSLESKIERRVVVAVCDPVVAGE